METTADAFADERCSDLEVILDEISDPMELINNLSEVRPLDTDLDKNNQVENNNPINVEEYLQTEQQLFHCDNIFEVIKLIFDCKDLKTNRSYQKFSVLVKSLWNFCCVIGEML